MSIVDNKKAFHDYFIEERYEAGLVLEGWEVKAIRAGRANIKEAYVILKHEEPYVIGTHVSALPTASTRAARGCSLSAFAARYGFTLTLTFLEKPSELPASRKSSGLIVCGSKFNSSSSACR